MDDGRDHNERKGSYGRQWFRAGYDMWGSFVKMINFENHHLIDMVWPIKSARTDQVYDVVMTKKGFKCNCIAGTYKGKCKHAKYVYELLDSDLVIKYDIL